jgi:hypothetical protein
MKQEEKTMATAKNTVRRIPRKAELQARVFALTAGSSKPTQETVDIVNAEGFVDANGNPWTVKLLSTNYYKWPKQPVSVTASEVSDISEAPPQQQAESDQTAEQALGSPLASDMSEPTDDTTEPLPSDRSDTSDAPQPVMSEPSVISENTSMPSAWQDQIRQIIQKELSVMQPEPQFTKEDIVQIIQKELTSMESSIQTLPKDQTPSLVPAPTPGERIKGDKGKPVNPGKRVKVAGTVDEVLERLIREWCRENRTTLSYALDAALWHFFGKPKLSFEMSTASETTTKGE